MRRDAVGEMERNVWFQSEETSPELALADPQPDHLEASGIDSLIDSSSLMVACQDGEMSGRRLLAIPVSYDGAELWAHMLHAWGGEYRHFASLAGLQTAFEYSDRNYLENALSED